MVIIFVKEVISTEGLQKFDFAILDWIQQNLRCTFLDWVLPLITTLGNGGAIWIILALILLFTKKYRRVGAMVGLALIFGLIVGNLTLKPLIARTRPFDIREFADLLISKPTDFSFPSGHTLASFEAATVLMINDKKLGIPALTLAVLIAFSRLYLYVHYPSDIFAGVLLGVFFGVLATAIINRVWKQKTGFSEVTK